MEEGKKYDSGKDRWDLLPMECVEDVVKILTFGSVKYGPNNWQNVEPFNDRYYAALMRHLVAWRKGEETDTESGLPHLSHAMCNVIFLLWYEKHKIRKIAGCEIDICKMKCTELECNAD
jgi:hypothetical protein